MVLAILSTTTKLRAHSLHWRSSTPDLSVRPAHFASRDPAPPSRTGSEETTGPSLTKLDQPVQAHLSPQRCPHSTNTTDTAHRTSRTQQTPSRTWSGGQHICPPTTLRDCQDTTTLIEKPLIVPPGSSSVVRLALQLLKGTLGILLVDKLRSARPSPHWPSVQVYHQLASKVANQLAC